MANQNTMPQLKKIYKAPTLVSWGTVADLTRAGLTHPGGDCQVYDEYGTRGSNLNAKCDNNQSGP